MVSTLRSAGRVLSRLLMLCWSATWRAVFAAMLGFALVTFVDGILVPDWGGPAFGAIGGFVLGAPVGLLIGPVIGVVTAAWFDPPRDPRRYHWLAGLLGALCVLGVVFVTSRGIFFYEDRPGHWRTPGDMLGGWPSFWRIMLGLVVCGWLAGWWAASAQISRWEEARASGEAKPEDA